MGSQPSECRIPGQPPELPGRLPVLGHGLKMVRGPVAFGELLASTGPVAEVYVGRRPVVAVTSSRLMREILVAHEKSFEKGYIFDKARPALGNGLFTSEGEFHRKQRKLLRPEFRHERIEGCSETLRARVSAVSRSIRDGDVFDFAGLASELTLGAFFDTMIPELGSLSSTQLDEISSMAHDVIRNFLVRTLYPYSWMEKIPISPNRRFERGLRVMKCYIDRILAEDSEDKHVRGSLVGRLIDTSDAKNATEARRWASDELASLILASGTPATVMAWLFYELARHPEVERKLRDEIGRARHAGADSPQIGHELEYTDSVLNETMRLHTPNWFLMRRCCEPVRLGNYEFETGTEFLFSLTQLHRDPASYHDPDRFDPNRWTGGLMRRLPPGSFIPYGAGSHRCIGADLARSLCIAITTTLVDQWHFQLPKSYRPRIDPLHPLLALRTLPVTARAR
ncbi:MULTISPECIES: cytochrome P450 [unclassified Nocardia]|uniref:cytochrome P450 n=1 Tax=unclassified Nocardia TaxID=2637762 RepID=UPI001CE484C6|nr:MULTISPECIES: cytochrome P450 [unclassified Nocardia]